MAADSITVRAVRIEDFPAVAAITNHYIQTTAIHFATEPVMPESLRDSWQQTRERYPFVVAVADDRIVGYAKAGLWRERAAYLWTPECGVYVDPASQRRGLGTALYTHLFATMTRQGFRSVIAGITVPNEPSIRMHESMGFVAQGVIHQAGWKFGQWWSVGFWQKPLNTGDAPARPLLSVSEVEAAAAAATPAA